MYQTYQQLKKLEELYVGNTDYTNEALEEAVAKYKQNQTPEVFAFIYCRIFKVTLSLARRFSTLNEAEKSSYSTEVLHNAILNYEASKNITIQSYYSSCLNNYLLNQVRALKTDKRKADENSVSHATTDFYGEEDTGLVVTLLLEDDNNYEITEMVTDLKKLNLTPKELAYCEAIVTSTGTPPRSSDIAHSIGVSRAAVTQIKERLKVKLIPMYR